MNYVVKVSQEGFDVTTAADYQLLFSSEWPTLKIAATGTFSIAANQTTIQTIYTHGLSYIPLVMLISDHLYSDSSTAFPSSGRGVQTDYRIFVDGTALKFYADGILPGNYAFSGRYFIFAQSVADTVSPTSFITSAATAGATSNYKFVISKEGKDVSSTDPRDFVINSSYRTPNIHMAGQLVTTGFTTSVTHNLGYPPLYITMLKGDGSLEVPEYWVPFLSSTNGASVAATNTTLDFSDIAGNTYYYVIFKDPFTLV